MNSCEEKMTHHILETRRYQPWENLEINVIASEVSEDIQSSPENS